MQLRGGTGQVAMERDADGQKGTDTDGPRGTDTDREAVRALLQAWKTAAQRDTEAHPQAETLPQIDTVTDTDTETETRRGAFIRSVRQLSAHVSGAHSQGTPSAQREGAEGRRGVLETAWVEQGIAVWVPGGLTLTGPGA